MTDTLTQNQRSALMSRVKQKNTAPEVHVRKILHRHGFRFRLHDRKLPGSPDVVLPKYRTVIFVHGCLWHGHNCRRGRLPTTNADSWRTKVEKNIERDKAVIRQLESKGWNVEIVWQCEAKDLTSLVDRLRQNLLAISSTRSVAALSR
ncbi:very short patch repair endonuclease [Endobacterium cereale]|uniref:very short patch repair endonuclease n=1 Tax=Endobacterium cereale TaxID=2663029 RepID=UPI002B45CF3B|nr:very short patch repair endonuclease [Endobacterium cereale]MEB2846804.1 very short patch repair endonuclease [Endobacterium cereale]